MSKKAELIVTLQDGMVDLSNLQTWFTFTSIFVVVFVVIAIYIRISLKKHLSSGEYIQEKVNFFRKIMLISSLLALIGLIISSVLFYKISSLKSSLDKTANSLDLIVSEERVAAATIENFEISQKDLIEMDRSVRSHVAESLKAIKEEAKIRSERNNTPYQYELDKLLDQAGVANPKKGELNKDIKTNEQVMQESLNNIINSVVEEPMKQIDKIEKDHQVQKPENSQNSTSH
ncbi:TPA: hypothetical protein ACGIK9_002835 [Acinetobacter baumannii]|uniref:hypothetical protein n=1 Tax=Acinetobacter baumannii TaxID=470 RepID=UPI00338F9E1C